MTALVLTLRRQPPTWLDMSPLVPDRLSGLSMKAMRSLPIRCGRVPITVADLFDLKKGDPQHVQIRRATERMVRIGAGMRQGTLEVRGHGGQYLGEEMRGGRISVRGDAGDWAGAGMAGGQIEISGNAGDFVGAPLPGRHQGMSEGWITVEGNAGQRLGDRMRRGTILVFGNAGDYAGSHMVAGTLVIVGRTGRYVGYGMRRGTIILGKKPSGLLSTFHDCGNLKMEFLRLFFKQTASISRRFARFRDLGPEVRRFAGDSAGGGKGEVLILVNPPVYPAG